MSEKPGYMQIRTTLPRIPSSVPLPPPPSLSSALCRDRYPFLPTFLRIVTPRRISRRYPAVVRASCRGEKGASTLLLALHHDTRFRLFLSPRDISPVFHPSRIDITRSVTSTLKPLSSRRSLFPVCTTEPPESGQGGGSSKSDGRVTAL